MSTVRPYPTRLHLNVYNMRSRFMYPTDLCDKKKFNLNHAGQISLADDNLNFLKTSLRKQGLICQTNFLL